MLSTFLLLSCSQNDELTQDVTSTPQLRSLADGGNDVLGYSYDITANYLDLNATKFRVIDMDKLKKDKPLLIYPEGGTQIKQDIYAGSNAETMLKDITKKVDLMLQFLPLA